MFCFVGVLMLDENPLETTVYSLAPRPPGLPERRNEQRHMSLLRVGSLIVGDRRELCLIRNVSVGGMLIRAYSAIMPGTRVAIELKQGEPVHGTALWMQDELVGINFDEPIDVLALITTSADAPRPRMPRLEVRCTAWVRHESIVHRTRAINISQGGIRVETTGSIPAGAQVTVTLPGLPPVQGAVRWVDDEACGVTFNRVLPLSQLVASLGDQ